MWNFCIINKAIIIITISLFLGVENPEMVYQKSSIKHLVVEQTDTLLDKGNTELLGSLKDRGIVLAAGGSGNVLDTRAGGTEDVVDEGELVNVNIRGTVSLGDEIRG